MAEAVRQQLELQLPELHDLRKKRIFSSREVKEIIRRRTAFEYALRRRQSRKSDYIKYIEYEMNVEALRVKRKKQRGSSKRNSVSEFSIIKRIHFIYNRALQKFKGDLKLWLQYFQFCRQTGGQRRLGHALARCVQYHGHVPDVWILAAKWEFEDNADIKMARTLMQRGIRLNPAEKRLWLEYLRLELLYLEKMRLRAQVLGIDQNQDIVTKEESAQKEEVEEEEAAASDAEQAMDDDDGNDSASSGEDAAQEDEEERAGFNFGEKDEQEGEREQEDLFANIKLEEKSFLKGAVALIILQNALDRFGLDADLLQECLSILRLFPETRHIRDELYSRMKTSDDPSIVALVCHRPVDDVAADDVALVGSQLVEAVNNSSALFSAAFKKHNSDSLREKHVMFIYGLIPTNTDVATDLCHCIIKAADASIKAKSATASVYKAKILAHCALNKMQQAVTAADQACRAKPDSVPLWQLRLKLVMLHAANFDEVDNVFKEAISAVENEDGVLQLWQQRLAYACSNCNDNQRVEELYRAAIASRLTSVPALECSYVQWAAVHRGVAHARQVFAWLTSQVGRDSYELFCTMEAVERSRPKLNVDKLRRIFKQALHTHGANRPELWEKAVRLELDSHNLLAVRDLYAQAVKALQDPTEFIASYNSLRQGAAIH